ncbi:MAG: DUF378 domain-containing protein [Candidatus Magasanikbacteria bacterium]|nr:DUF378 domain-containing protein [Candidatus Magasanikbacteria bacterium]
MGRIKFLDKLVFGLVIIGALNWGLIGFFDFNLISYLFGEFSYLTRFLYILYGLSGLYLVFISKKFLKK